MSARVPLSPEAWRRVNDIFHEALDRPADIRQAFVEEACAGAPDVRDEVESLLAAHARAAEFIEHPAGSVSGLLPLEADQSLVGHTLGHYHVTRVIGEGGMGVVYLARDERLGRVVALKALAPRFTNDERRRERLRREARAVAALSHPRIATVYALEEIDGHVFIAGEYVPGETLRAELERGPLGARRAIDAAVEIVDALAAAHERGVIHRDLKPDNIIRATDGHLKILDFGLARMLDLPDGAAQLTLDGTFLGTPAYMSPEQAAGAPTVDHRADIYSFGCVAYELLTGVTPFSGREAHQLILAHIGQAPPSCKPTAANVPPALVDLVMRCLAKLPEERPQTAGELVAALESVATPATLPVTPVRRSWPIQWIAGAVAVVAVAGWFSYQAMGGRGATTTITTGGPSLAVIPFTNIGGDTATEYFADGITDELATALGRIPELRIAARSSAYRFKGRRDLDVRTVGRELAVNLILTGTARRSGQQVRVSAQLSSAADGVEIWSESFDRPFDDVLKLTDSLTAIISTALARQLSGGTVAAATTPVRTQIGTSSPAAYEAYLKGKYSLLRRRAGLEGAADEFASAIQLDPQFARAYAGLGTALALLTYFGDSQPPDRPARSRDAALTALRLDSTNAEAHVALGILALTQHRWQDAEQSLRQAIAAEPGLSDAHFHLGRALIYQGRLADGVKSIEVARGLEPFSPVYTVWLGHTLAWVGRREQALAETRRAWELDSNSILVHNLGSLAFLQQGETGAARHIGEIPTSAAFQRGTMAYVLARTGATAAARQLMRPVIERSGRGWYDQINLAVFHLGLGQADSAMIAMERAVERGEPIGAFHGLSSPVYDPLRSDPRFAATLRKIGLDPAVLAAPGGGRTP